MFALPNSWAVTQLNELDRRHRWAAEKGMKEMSEKITPRVEKIELNERPPEVQHFVLEIVLKSEPNVRKEYYLYGMRDVRQAVAEFEGFLGKDFHQKCETYNLMNVF